MNRTQSPIPAEPACWSWPMPVPPAADPYVALVRWHAGRCGLCGMPETARKNGGPTVRRLSEDHDHATGATRGLLCRRCNLHEGRCASPACACVGWRSRPSAAILGVSIAHTPRDKSVDMQFRRDGIDPEEGRRESGRRMAAALGRIIADDLPDA